MSHLNVCIVGHRGWIGSKMQRYFKNPVLFPHRMEEREKAFAFLRNSKRQHSVTHVIVAAGVTGRPNVDWCEENKERTVVSNVVGVLNIVDICHTLGLHCTLFATGCIYNYDDSHLIGSGIRFNETEEPNFSSSWYSKTKILVEDLIKNTRYINNTLVLRLRMPVSDSLKDERNFITKLTKYPKLINVPNSLSVLPDLLPVVPVMMEKRVFGVYNFVNPGVISHHDLMEMYIKHIDPEHIYEAFAISDQDKILKAKRSNVELDTSKLEHFMKENRLAPLPDVNVSVLKIVQANAH